MSNAHFQITLHTLPAITPSRTYLKRIDSNQQCTHFIEDEGSFSGAEIAVDPFDQPCRNAEAA
jgi:hypothetical protein